jgi:3-hydroxyacyl-CoA dehydrogenase/enoyl-CoA hydratase/3-hydroxybutyryl-CoA epimerase
MTDWGVLWGRDKDGIVVLTLDDPGGGESIASATFHDALAAAVARLEAEREQITGVVLMSARPAFYPAAGLDPQAVLVATRADAPALSAGLAATGALLRRLETLGRPVVAAIRGSALGDGLALALATHRRIALEDPAIEIGMPQVRLGLLAGHGGLTRTVRLLGITEALTQVLLEGKLHSPERARTLGLIDDLAASLEELMLKAKSWILEHAGAVQPWDRDDYRMPGGTPASAKLAQFLPAYPANLRKQLKGANYPAPRAIMAAAVEGAQLDFAGALAVETRYLVDLICGPVAKNMVQAFHFDIARAAGGRQRTDAEPPFRPTRAVILGAGMMGAAIAYITAAAGIDVVLKDVSLTAAERGKSYSEGHVRRAVERGRTTPAAGEALLARITPTASPADASGADLLIEAVFEDAALKADVLREIEPVLAGGALLASNTSTLPITELAEAVTRPADFIGLHFFSPAERMPLLEIIVGKQTSAESVARALDVATALGKTPIVVNDVRGFFTSRVITKFLDEAMTMVLEGVPAASIEQASAQAGYPAPALQLCDELSLTLMRKIRSQYKAAAAAEGASWETVPAERLIDELIDTHERAGRLAGAGFYDYVDGKRTGLWAGLRRLAPAADPAPPLRDLEQRMLFIEALEAVKCRDEGVIESVADANIGSILGIGFPAWTGGVLQYINGYDGGPAGFVVRARELVASYGERFAPPPSLLDLAERGGRYGD